MVTGMAAAEAAAKAMVEG
jgi:hypothetical protein